MRSYLFNEGYLFNRNFMVVNENPVKKSAEEGKKHTHTFLWSASD